MAPKPEFIVVGGGLAGLMSTIKLAEAGHKVQLISIVPVKRSHSVCAQGGINGAVNTKGEGDSPAEHFDDSVYGGDFLANQGPVKRMCEAAPGIIYMLDRMGVMFNRTPEGNLDFRRFGGTKHHRTAFAGATTGQQILYALDEQVRRHEVTGLVTKFENWEFVSPVIDEEGTARGVICQNLCNGELKAFRADATIFCTGGVGVIFGRSTNSVSCTGSAQGSLYMNGAIYANGEFIQVHPTAIPGEDKCRLMSESARGEGGRVWVPKNGKPWYFLEEMFPAYGNLVPRDVATRAIFKVCSEGLGIDGKNMVYLDLTHKPKAELDRKLGGILEIYETFVGEDPRKVPMKIFPAMHYTMGGLWVDDNTHMTNIPGYFAGGECEYQYHGANRLGANSLVSCIYSGMVAGPAAVNYAKGLKKSAADVSSSLFEGALRREEEKYAGILKMRGTENPYKIAEEMGDMMTAHVTVIRNNKDLKATLGKLETLLDRWKHINVLDDSKWMNMPAIFTRELYNMIQLARVITKGALQRDESRGAHYKPEFPERDDARFMKTSMARFKSNEGIGEPDISYADVDVSLIKPRKRVYDVDKGAAAAAAGKSTKDSVPPTTAIPPKA
jgi:succinate dehydrogenase / fumarate reductase, flavoprotein subunit